MIRVLHIFNIMDRAGAETMIMNVYRNIDRNKIQFDFICMEKRKGDYDDEIKSLGGNIYIIDPPKNVGYIKHIKEIIKICKEKGPYKAIHIPTQFHSGIVCLAAWIAKVPIRIVHSHSAGEIETNFKRSIYQFFCRCLINIFATDKIACGEKARDFLFGKSNKNKKNVIILKNGIDIDKYSQIEEKEILKLKEKYEISKEDIIIGHVGRFSKVKNHIFFVKLAENMLKEKKNFKILLVGDGELKKEFEEKIKEKKLEKNFILVGKQENIPLFMNLMNVFVMPSLYEGFPMVIIETLAAGNKCVVSDAISTEINVIDNSVTFLNLEDNIQKWIDEIDENSKEKLDKQITKKILTQEGFNIINTVKVLEKIYLR